MVQPSLPDNFNFELFGQSNDPKIPKFRGYVSSIDPTTVGIGVLIGGSQNTYKSLLGTIKVRSGLKLRGPADATAGGVFSSFEWETTLGVTRVLRVDNGKLQVEYDTGSGIVYADLLTGLTDDEMLFSFAPWYDENLQKDELIFVNGKQEINMWPGGIVAISVAANTVGIIGQIEGPQTANTVNYQLGGRQSGGIGYIVGDILTVTTGNEDALLEVDEISAKTAVATAAISSGHAGTGYTIGDIVSINGGGVGTLAVLLITGVDGEGGVTSFSIINPGIGYAISSANATTNIKSAGGGSGFEADVSTLGVTITAWHLTNNGSGYSAVNNNATSGGTGTEAVIDIITVDTGRISIGETYTLSQLGFSGTLASSDGTLVDSGGTISVNGTAYTYQTLGDNGFSFIGVSPDPSAIASNSVAIAQVVVSTRTASGNLFSLIFGAKFTNDFVSVNGNQLYVGCYNARTSYISSDTNYLNFAAPIFRTPGDPDVFIGDSNLRGVASKTGQKGNVVIFGSVGDSYSLTRQVSTFITSNGTTQFVYETVLVDKSTSSDLSSPLGQDFIDAIGDTIIFLDGNNQLREFGTLRNLATPVYPILSLDVYTELAGVDFTGGAIRAVAEQSGESVYIVSPRTGALYIYQIRSQVDQVGNLTAERVWQPPFIVGASRVAVIDGITYVYSNSNPQLYQLWDTGQYYDDSPSGDQLPYESHATFAYLSLPDRTLQLNFDKLYFEGYMQRGTNLYCNIYYEFQGSKSIRTITINKPVAPGQKLAKFYDSTATPSLGDVSLGEVPLGEGITARGGASVPKFRAMRRAQSTDVFEFALDIASYDVNAQWELLVLGTNLQPTTRQPTGIMGLSS